MPGKCSIIKLYPWSLGEATLYLKIVCGCLLLILCLRLIFCIVVYYVLCDVCECTFVNVRRLHLEFVF